MRKTLLFLLGSGILMYASAATPLDTHQPRQSFVRIASEHHSGKTKVRKAEPTSFRPTSVSESAGPITEAPQGDIKTYIRSGTGLYSKGFWAEMGSDQGFYTEVVWCQDGSVYIKNPLLFYQTGSYLKGKVVGDEIVVDLPQLIEIAEGDSEEEPYEFYLTMFTGVLDEDLGEIEFVPVEGECQLKYKIDGENFGRQLDETDFSMLGLIWDGYFMDYGELSCQYTPFSADLTQVPDGITTEKWVCSYGGDGHYVNVGFSGPDVYIQGIAPAIQECWIKGVRADNGIVFDSGQFLGIDPDNQHVSFFWGATMSLEEDPDWGDMVMTPHLASDVKFTYDEATKIMTTSDAILINASTTEPYYSELLDKPLIRTAPTNSAHIPQNPVILNFMPASVLGTGALQFDLPRISTDGDILDTADMYYNVFFDGQLAELIEGTPDIPWDYSDGWDFSVYGITHEAYYYDTTVAKVGLQNCYRDGSKVVKSDIVYTDGTVVSSGSGVLNSTIKAEPIKVGYTDIMGRPADARSHGLLLRKTNYSDGTQTVEKIFNR